MNISNSTNSEYVNYFLNQTLQYSESITNQVEDLLGDLVNDVEDWMEDPLGSSQSTTAIVCVITAPFLFKGIKNIFHRCVSCFQSTQIIPIPSTDGSLNEIQPTADVSTELVPSTISVQTPALSQRTVLMEKVGQTLIGQQVNSPFSIYLTTPGYKCPFAMIPFPSDHQGTTVEKVQKFFDAIKAIPDQDLFGDSLSGEITVSVGK